MLEFLIEEVSSCNPSVLGWHGTTPLHNAAEAGHLNIVQYLVEKHQVDPLSRMREVSHLYTELCGWKFKSSEVLDGDNADLHEDGRYISRISQSIKLLPSMKQLCVVTSKHIEIFYPVTAIVTPTFLVVCMVEDLSLMLHRGSLVHCQVPDNGVWV